MGHIRLGTLPQTRRWDQVVELISRDGSAAAVATAALNAAEEGFKRAADDAAGREALRSLAGSTVVRSISGPPALPRFRRTRRHASSNTSRR